MNGPTFQNFSTKTDLISIGLLGVLMFVVAYYSDLERGMTAACSGAAIEILARYCAYLWSRTWFWVLIGVFVALHVLVVIYVPWARNEYSALALMPIGIADFGIMFVCVRLVERSFDSPRE